MLLYIYKYNIDKPHVSMVYICVYFTRYCLAEAIKKYLLMDS